MADESGDVTRERSGNGHRSAAEIHHEIQRTRANIDLALDRLQEELRPRRLIWKARHSIEPKLRAAAEKARDGIRRQANEDPRPLVAAGAAAAGLLALALFRRRRKKKRTFPAEQKGL